MKKKRQISIPEMLKRHRKEILCVKCVFALIFTFGASASGAELKQDKPISLDLHDVGVEQFLDAVKQQTQYRFMYNTELVHNAGKVSVTVREKEIGEVLNMVLSWVNLDYELFNGVILIKEKHMESSKQQQQRQSRTVTGKVLDSSGKPIPGMTVELKGTKNVVQTDRAGGYSITVPASGEVVLVFSCLGKVTREVPYTGQKSLDITMQNATKDLGEVVVTGYFNINKESYTGTATSFTGEELRTISTGNILSTLAVLDPSFVQIENNEMGSNPNYIPEFEIRGAGSIKADYQGSPNMPTFIMDGFEVSAELVFDLDPNRVKRVTILKDAAATAIYGSRAANGVVVIETRTPEKGAMRLSYNGSMNFEVADLSGYNLMNAREKLQYEAQAGFFDPGTTPSITDKNYNTYNERYKMIAQGIDVNWLTIPVRELALGQRHSIGLDGGNETVRYGIDLFYANRKGAMKGSNRDNFGGGVRLQYDMGKFRFSNYTSFDFTKAVNSPYGSFGSYLKANPYYNPYDENGQLKQILYTYQYYDEGFRTERIYNELFNATLPTKNQNLQTRFLNNFSVEYNIIEGLRLKSNLSITLENGRSDYYLSREHLSFRGAELQGSYALTNSRSFSYDANIVMSYFKTIGNHMFNAGLIYNMRESTFDSNSMTAYGFQNTNMDHISMASEFKEGTKPGGSYDIRRLAGLAVNLNYSYDNRFLMDFSLRSDGSSLYGENNPWSTFWSVGLGWNLHYEKFLKDSRVINMLKIRGSIGTTGGQRFDPYQSMAMYSYIDERIRYITYVGYHGVLLMGFGNPNLKWQQVEKQNFGIDFGLFGFLTGSFNVYKELSKNLLMDVTIAPSLGFATYKENFGKVQNTGFDLTLHASILRPKTENGVRWSVTASMAHNENKILEISDALQAFNDAQDEKVKTKPTIRYQEGESQSTIWAVESLGIDPATGNEIYLDLDGNKTDVWSADNYKPFKTTDPLVSGTVSTVLAYRGWELNAYMSYRYGGYVYNQTLVDKIENVDPNENGDRRILYDRWQKPGDVAQYRKIPTERITTYPTSRFIEKNNYVTMKSLSLSYDVERALLKRIGIDRMRLSAITNDLFTISTVRMERGTNYPFARTYSLSVQITF